jgi:manganese/zinc/iron transport system substrate-binding protein
MKKSIPVIVVFLIAVLNYSCTKQDGETVSARDLGSHTINVVTTTGMIADAVKNVGGERVKVTALMGPGVDPHLYKASEGDVGRMGSADIIFYNGLHLEAKMGEVLEKMGGRIRTVAVSRSIDESRLINAEGFAEAHDPHIWFDVTLWMNAVKEVRDTLVEMDGGHAESYNANAARYQSELEKLNAYVHDQAGRIAPQRRVLITAHDAFNYFGKAYGFEVLGLQGISTVTEAGARDVQDLADLIAERRIPAVFVESSVPRKNVEALQAAVQARGFQVEIGGELFSDAMGSPGTVEGTYLGMVRHNIDTIVEALLTE